MKRYGGKEKGESESGSVQASAMATDSLSRCKQADSQGGKPAGFANKEEACKEIATRYSTR